MKYAVIQLGGKQYRVTEDQEFSTNALTQKEGDTFMAEQVYLVVDGKTRKLGTPFVKDAKVKLEVVKHGNEPKIRVATYKAKSRQRKVYGHKQPATRLKVVSIA